ncbi:MAG: hypothetical protein KJO78_16415 [Alphaproteobacteria bacterium]|nr:hypothetical protein [Alphaproteobacteria bacterium]
MEFRLKIDGVWTAAEFGRLFQSIDELSEWLGDSVLLDSSGSVLQDENGNPLLDSSGYSSFEVKRVVFGSPGFADLAGIGKLVEQVRLFLQFLIERCDRRNDRVLDSKERELEINRKKLELLRELGELVETNPRFSEILRTNSANDIIEAILEGRVTGIEQRSDD